MARHHAGEAFTRERDRMLADIADLLDAERTRQGMPITRWVQRSGVSKRCAAYLVQGKRDPRLGTLLRLASGLGLNLRVSVRRKPEPSHPAPEEAAR